MRKLLLIPLLIILLMDNCLLSTDRDVTNYGIKIAGSTPLANSGRTRIGRYIRTKSVRNSNKWYTVYPTANEGYVNTGASEYQSPPTQDRLKPVTYNTLFRSEGLQRTSSTVRSENFRRRMYGQEHLGHVRATARHPQGEYHALYHSKEIIPAIHK